MIAVTLEQASTIAIVATTALVVAAVLSFWVMKSLVQKLVAAVLLGLLAFAVWTQRSALQDCADKVEQNYERTGVDVTVIDTECSFFGLSITISDPALGVTTLDDSTTAPPIGRTLARLTGAKTVGNTALRWIPLFLPTLESAFGATTAQLTTVLGVGEVGGLSTLAVGGPLDRRRERLVMVTGLSLVAASSVIALWGTLTAFAIAFFVLVVGISNFTVAGQTWISHRVGYGRRARSLGLFETSWALALLIGAPIVAVLINVFGWRGPFVALAIAMTAGAIVVAITLPKHQPVEAAAAASTPRVRITPVAWLVMFGSALTAMAGLSVFVISGSWLDEAFGVSTGGIGGVAAAFGAAELISSLTSAALADRLGKLRSTLAGLGALLAGLGVMVLADDRLWLGVIGLLVFLLGFEFAFVTSLSLVSEAMPDARGNTLAVSNAVATFARAGGAILSGWLFDTYGINGTAALSSMAATTAVVCLVLSRRL